jgi:hypothetical protein
VGSTARAQETVPQPAQSAADQARNADEAPAAPTGEPPATAPEPVHPRSWEAPPAYETVVVGTQVLREEERIGDYAQPRWTARRRFPTTRVFVVPAETATVEWWLETKLDPAHPNKVRYRSQYELELGLGHRLQLDLYLTTQQLGTGAPILLHREKVELRYAFADWGVLPLNPTLYVEAVRQHDAPPLGEVKLLLGTELVPRWHFGANLVFEREMGAAHEHEMVATAAVAYTVNDEQLSVGAEVQATTTDVEGARFAFDAVELVVGPSLQWRPVPAMHVDLVALTGVTIQDTDGERTASMLLKPLVVLGWEL